MSDNEFLLHVIKLFEDVEKTVPAQMWFIKDANFLHQYASRNIITLFGEAIIKNKKISKTLSNELIEKINTEEDQVVIENLQVIYILKIYRLKNNQLVPYISVKYPLINPDTNNVVGVLVQLIEISITNLNQQIFELYGKKFKAGLKIQLSKREKQVIFLFLNNLNSQEIAATISKLEQKNISRSTIDSLFVDQLYPKFDVFNRPALTQKLRQLGYTTLIPESLLTENSIKLDKVSIY